MYEITLESRRYYHDELINNTNACNIVTYLILNYEILRERGFPHFSNIISLTLNKKQMLLNIRRCFLACSHIFF
jgi:hypothetical protein